jgi:hypothetical protein
MESIFPKDMLSKDSGLTLESIASKLTYFHLQLHLLHWKTTSYAVNPGISFGGTIITDLFVFFPACTRDDTYKYNAGGTGVEDEGATKCDPLDPQSSPFTWAFNPTETILSVRGNSENIVQLDETTLKTSTVLDGKELEDFGGISGINYTIISTYSNQ